MKGEIYEVIAGMIWVTIIIVFMIVITWNKI